MNNGRMDQSKHSDASPPHFPATSGEAFIYFSDYNGRAVFGNGEAQFETKWSGSSGDSIIAYNDPDGIRGIALAPGMRDLQEFTLADVARLNFTSRVRRPREGEVVVFENTAGRFLAVEIVDVLAISHGDSEDRLEVRFSVLPAATEGASEYAIIELARSLEEELRRRRNSEAVIAPMHGGIGHNNPPEATPLNVTQWDDTIDDLRTVCDELAMGKPRRSVLVRSARKLQEAAGKIAVWVGGKLDLAIDEFSKQIGKSLGDGRIYIAGWLVISGQLEQLAAMLTRWAGF